jgi:hypothetical protein
MIMKTDGKLMDLRKSNGYGSSVQNANISGFCGNWEYQEMPNWCENDLRVYGKTCDVNRFRLFAKSYKEVLEANNFIPYPSKFREITRISDKYSKYYHRIWDFWLDHYDVNPKSRGWLHDGFNSGGYEWCIDNWGTKRGFCRPFIEDEYYDEHDGEADLLYRFDTAWSPPIPLIEVMGKKFPKLEFELRYFEAGMAFNGIFRMTEGEIVDDETAKYYGHRGG